MRKLIALFCITLLATASFASGTVSQSDLANSGNEISPVPPGDCTPTAAEAEIIALKRAGQSLFAIPKTESEMEALRGQAATTRMDPPPNDLCIDAQLVTGPYPVQIAGSFTEATVDCPGLLDWNAVWYEIFLPYEVQNVVIDWCDDPEVWDNYGIILMDDCACDDYIIGSYDWACANGNLVLTFHNFAGPGTILYPHYVQDYDLITEDFVFNLNVTTDAPMEGNTCEDPIIIESFPYSHEWVTAGYSDNGHNPSPDVFYEFLLPDEGVYTFTTCMEETYDGYFDTALHILAEDCATVVHTNDDNCDGDYSGWSTITTCLSQGLYYLVVEGSGSESGNYRIEFNYEGSCDPCDPPICPDWGIDEVEPNDGSNGNPPVYDSIAPGETHCGSTWSSGYTRDSDWYQFEVAADTEVEFFLDGEEGHSLALYLVDESSGSPEILATGQPQGACSDYTFIYTIATAGTYSAFVAYDDYYGEGPNSVYTLNWVSLETVNTPDVAPVDINLAQNYPNPFNPGTTIEFSLPVTASVQLAVYDITGHRVALLADGPRPAGNHMVQFDATDMPSGLYFYRLTATGKSVARKMILVN
jgi:hypothetical protein